MEQLKEEIKRSKKLMGVKEGLNLPKKDLGPQKPEEKTLHCTVELEGYNYDDLADALREALKHIEQGYHSGMNSNEDSGYSFETSGEEWSPAPDIDDEDIYNNED